jgi:hypothetical protein
MSIQIKLYFSSTTMKQPMDGITSKKTRMANTLKSDCRIYYLYIRPSRGLVGVDTSNNLIRLSRLVGHQDKFHKRIIFAEAVHIALVVFGTEHGPLAMKWACSRELGRNLQDVVVHSERIPQDALPGVFTRQQRVRSYGGSQLGTDHP